jgi:putative redox protein
MAYNTKTANIVWEGQGVGFTGKGGSGFSMRFDNPSGPNAASPMEVIAISAGACTAMDVIDILRKKKQAVTGFEVNVVGGRTTEHPMVFNEIKIEYVVTGRNVDPKAVERAIELSQTKYCSVNNMLSKSAAIKTGYRIIEEAQAVPAPSSAAN